VFVVCPFVDEETNGSYPLANGLNGLVHLCNYLPMSGVNSLSSPPADVPLGADFLAKPMYLTCLSAGGG
jgi:hypothetical protein